MYDCQSCIDKGYEIIKEMEMAGHDVFIVSEVSGSSYQEISLETFL